MPYHRKTKEQFVKNAVQLHGGQITVDNADDGGLRFDFTLKK